jgi:hypothetical protein
LSRAYFTAATSEYETIISLGVNTSLQYNSNKKIIYGSLPINGYESKNLTKIERDKIKLTPEIKSILIGLLLSDGWMQSRKGWNPRIGFKQSIKHFEYLWKVHNEIKYLTSKYPHICKTIKRGKLFYSLQFETRQLECLKEIRSLFYIDISPNKYVRSLNIN